MRLAEVEVVLAELASSQWGLLTAVQAQQRGVSRPRLVRLTEAGLLVRLTHGVYALRGSMTAGPVDLRAAWLALDPARSAADRLGDGIAGAVVSHASAAVLHGLGDLDADRHEFTAPVRKQSRRPELRLHRGQLVDDEVTLHEGLPVTTAARTIIDLVADGHDGGHVAGVLADAVRTRRIDPEQLGPRLAPHAARFGLPRHDGDALVAHLLDLGGVTEDVDADRIAAVARAAGVSVPEALAASAAMAGFAAQMEFQLAPWREQMAGSLREILDQLQPTAVLQAQLREMTAPVDAQIAAQMAAVLDQLQPTAALQAKLQEVLTPARAIDVQLPVQTMLQHPALDAGTFAVDQALRAAASSAARTATPPPATLDGPDDPDS